MSETKFTPAPWTFDKYENLKHNGELIKVSGISIPCGHSQVETKANMLLIAAAPEMYNMLKMCANILNGDDAINEVSVSDIENLLSKARGESLTNNN